MNKSEMIPQLMCKFVQILREAAHPVEVGSNHRIYYGQVFIVHGPKIEESPLARLRLSTTSHPIGRR